MPNEPVGPALANPRWPTPDEIEAWTSKLDFAAEFEATGSPYSELDESGQVVTRNSGPPSSAADPATGAGGCSERTARP
jgi:hypothetical protein